MKQFCITRLIALCATATRINYRAYDLASAALRALLRIAGRAQMRMDLMIYTYQTRLIKTQQQLPYSSEHWLVRSGEAAMRVVMTISVVVICLFVISDLTAAYGNHLIAMWQESK